jgi:hypothetical protein
VKRNKNLSDDAILPVNAGIAQLVEQLICNQEMGFCPL